MQHVLPSWIAECGDLMPALTVIIKDPPHTKWVYLLGADSADHQCSLGFALGYEKTRLVDAIVLARADILAGIGEELKKHELKFDAVRGRISLAL